MLNIAKSNTGHREVFVAQPDGVTEKLAGKIFILLELEGKKNESKKIMEFLVEGIDEYYYQDEKIFLRDKIEGLELENIFEAFLTKLNRALTDFLLTEKIRVKSSDFNITLGLVFENKLMFSNFGRNKSYLIFRKKDQYEIINVEASASDLPIDDQPEISDQAETKREINFKIFSSVVSGEIPPGSYFFFTNETLPEYLSAKEMVLIITKLPPMVAAEQMKQSLAKVNAFAPFLGIIIKNTTGLSEQDENEEISESLSAHSSISGLNYTEKKTEDMLSPAGLINSSKFKHRLSSWLSVIYSFLKKLFSIFKKEDKKVKEAVESTKRAKQLEPETKKTEPVSPINIKTKILVVRSSSIFVKGLANFKNFIVNIFSADFWSGLITGFSSKLRSIHPKRKFLATMIIILVLVLVISLSITAKQKRLREHQENFDEKIASFQDRYNLINSYLLYDNEEGAKIIIGEINTTLDELKAKTEDQELILEKWRAKLQAERQKIQRLTIIEEVEKIFDTRDLNPSAEPRNLILDEENVYLADPAGKIIYTYNLREQTVSSILVNLSGEIDLDLPLIYNNRLHYLNKNNLVTIDTDTGQSEGRLIAGLSDKKTEAIDIYQVNDLLYSLHANENSILRHSPSPTYSQSSQWLQTELDLSGAVDMAVTGEIWILKDKADILRLYLGQEDETFNLARVDPPLLKANKLLTDNNNLYVFATDSLRLVVYSYDGSFVSQYQLPDLQSSFDLVIDFNTNQAYLLADTALYTFSLE